MPGFHVENFGCRAARADGEAVSDRLRSSGLSEQNPGEAEVVVVNTCSVTAEADREARAFIRRTHRLNPEARILVTGCYAQRAFGELAAMAGVAAVVGNSHKALAPQIAIAMAKHSLAAARIQGPKLDPVSGHDFSRAEEPGDLNGALRAAEKLPGIGALYQGTTSVVPKMLQDEQGALAPEFGGIWASAALEGTGFSPYINPSQLTGALAPEAGLVTVQSLLSTRHAPIWADDRFAHSFLEEAQLIPGGQTRPNLKIQEGCGNRCTFCVIPQTRGSSRSLPTASILKRVRGFVAAGGNELVLSGINLGRWGRDLPHSTDTRGSLLAGLVRWIFRETDLPRLRLSSIEPMDWDDEMMGLMLEFGGRRLCRHAHLPLQSGSDAVLRRMHRRYRPWHYMEKVAALLAAAGPELTLGADVMAGFPGETDNEFEESMEFVRALPFGYLHLFPFSPRPGTRGWALHEQNPVPQAAVEERMAALRALAAEKVRAHREQFAGRDLEAITLNTPPEMASSGRTSALTENFLPVEIDSRLSANRLVGVRVKGLTAEMKLQATVEAAGSVLASAIQT